MQSVDQIMERASLALGRMDYLSCEADCLQALAAARQAQAWVEYARILLPLQEARRQRRLIAAEGAVRLGTSDAEALRAWSEQIDAGGIVITQPCDAAAARALDEQARTARRHIEVLNAQNSVDADTWQVHSFRGPDVACEVQAPPEAWRDRLLKPGSKMSEDSRTPADWFVDASELLGDAALAQVTAPPGSIERIEQLEAMLEVVVDHEILHQRLGDAARAMGCAGSL